MLPLKAYSHSFPTSDSPESHATYHKEGTIENDTEADFSKCNQKQGGNIIMQSLVLLSDRLFKI